MICDNRVPRLTLQSFRRFFREAQLLLVSRHPILPLDQKVIRRGEFLRIEISSPLASLVEQPRESADPPCLAITTSGTYRRGNWLFGLMDNGMSLA
jgi:hypothetical protein